MMKHTERSAGIVLLRWTRDGWKFLALETDMVNKQGERKLDLPKGHLEEGEDWLDAAIRETEEEAGVSEDEMSFTWGAAFRDCERPGKRARMFIASTVATPVVSPNPKTKRAEHTGYMWLSLSADPRIERLHPYLRPAVSWALSVVSKRRLNSSHGAARQIDADD